MEQRKGNCMWILNKDKNALYNANEFKEIYVVDCLDIEASYGKEFKDEQCRILGHYESVLETEWAFLRLVEWLENPRNMHVFIMPYEMPKE